MIHALNAAMDLHIALIQHLKLVPGCSAIQWQNSALVSKCCRNLRSIGSVTTCCTESFAGCVTWRPRFCKDIFILLPAQSACALIGTMSNGNVYLFNAVEATGALDYGKDVALMCHVTADVSDGETQIVALAYDMWTLEFTECKTPARERYLALIALQELVKTISIGSARVNIQWTGDISVYDKLGSLSLPHEVQGVVGVDDQGDYFQIYKENTFHATGGAE